MELVNLLIIMIEAVAEQVDFQEMVKKVNHQNVSSIK